MKTKKWVLFTMVGMLAIAGCSDPAGPKFPEPPEEDEDPDPDNPDQQGFVVGFLISPPLPTA